MNLGTVMRYAELRALMCSDHPDGTGEGSLQHVRAEPIWTTEYENAA